MTDFYTLLAAQLRYQDADNPMDTAEMMGQMVQTQMMQTINQLSEVMVTTYAASMAGQEVTVAEVDGTGNYTGDSTVGTVEGVYLAGSSPLLIINGKSYSMSQLMVVGRMPDEQPPEGEGSIEGTEKPDGTEGVEKPDGTEEVEKPDETEEPEEPDGTEGPEKPDGTEEPEKPDGTEGPEKSGGTEEPETPDGTEEVEKPDGTEESDGTEEPGNSGTEDKGEEGQPEEQQDLFFLNPAREALLRA